MELERIIQSGTSSFADAGCSRRDASRFDVSTCYPPRFSLVRDYEPDRLRKGLLGLITMSNSAVAAASRAG